MKKILLFLFIIFLIIGAYAAWQVFGPTVQAPKDGYLYIKTGTSYPALKKQLIEEDIINGVFFLDKISAQSGFDKNVKPGRYKVKKGSSLINFIKMLKRGAQEPVNLVITKLRTKENLARLIGNKFEADSAAVITFLTSNDSLASFKVDTNTVMTLVMPNSYQIYWTQTIPQIIKRLQTEADKFWTPERKKKAAGLNLNKEQVYTMASIIEEETNKTKDKALIASVYLNRIAKGMRLEADPTVKYAMRDFALTRILHGHLKYPSPYNTYQNTGLPPGPISTATAATIDAVLDAPKTNYIFFVAKPDFKGFSNFAATYPEHLKFAKAYQMALDSLIIRKREKQKNP